MEFDDRWPLEVEEGLTEGTLLLRSMEVLGKQVLDMMEWDRALGEFTCKLSGDLRPLVELTRLVPNWRIPVDSMLLHSNFFDDLREDYLAEFGEEAGCYRFENEYNRCLQFYLQLKKTNLKDLDFEALWKVYAGEPEARALKVILEKSKLRVAGFIGKLTILISGEARRTNLSPELVSKMAEALTVIQYKIKIELDRKRRAGTVLNALEWEHDDKTPDGD